MRGYSATPEGRELVSHWEIDISVKLLQAQNTSIPPSPMQGLLSDAAPDMRSVNSRSDYIKGDPLQAWFPQTAYCSR